MCPLWGVGTRAGLLTLCVVRPRWVLGALGGVGRRLLCALVLAPGCRCGLPAVFPSAPAVCRGGQRVVGCLIGGQGFPACGEQIVVERGEEGVPWCVLLARDVGRPLCEDGTALCVDCLVAPVVVLKRPPVLRACRLSRLVGSRLSSRRNHCWRRWEGGFPGDRFPRLAKGEWLERMKRLSCSDVRGRSFARLCGARRWVGRRDGFSGKRACARWEVRECSLLE